MKRKIERDVFDREMYECFERMMIGCERGWMYAETDEMEELRKMKWMLKW